jgi:hypothetical protein
MNNLVILIVLTVLIVISALTLKLNLNLNLTAGTKNNTIDIKRELHPVVSQTGISIPAIDQILKHDDLAPGKQSSIWPAENLHKYCTSSIEIKPYGFPASSNLYKDWADKESNWQVEYSTERVSTDMSRVKFNLPQATSNLRAFNTKTPLINENYYHNPAVYCKANVKSFPCPNNDLDAKITLPTGSDNMTFPGLTFKQRVVDLEVKNLSNVNMANNRGFV